MEAVYKLKVYHKVHKAESQWTQHVLCGRCETLVRMVVKKIKTRRNYCPNLYIAGRPAGRVDG